MKHKILYVLFLLVVAGCKCSNQESPAGSKSSTPGNIWNDDSVKIKILLDRIEKPGEKLPSNETVGMSFEYSKKNRWISYNKQNMPPISRELTLDEAKKVDAILHKLSATRMSPPDPDKFDACGVPKNLVIVTQKQGPELYVSDETSCWYVPNAKAQLMCTSGTNVPAETVPPQVLTGCTWKWFDSKGIEGPTFWQAKDLHFLHELKSIIDAGK